MNIRVEFLYTSSNNITTIYVWRFQQLIDQLTMPDLLTAYTKKKIRKELEDKYKEE